MDAYRFTVDIEASSPDAAGAVMDAIIAAATAAGAIPNAGAAVDYWADEPIEAPAFDPNEARPRGERSEGFCP